MNLAKARELLRKDISKLSLEQLQRHKVKLLDAWRESKADYGMSQAVADGFYKVIGSESASGYSPTDIWLTHSLSERIDEVCLREAFLFKAKEISLPDEKSLTEMCLKKLQARGDKNCKVSNVRIFNGNGRVDALADVSFTWTLNGWEKNAEHKDMIFVYIDGEWKSPMFFY